MGTGRSSKRPPTLVSSPPQRASLWSTLSVQPSLKLMARVAAACAAHHELEPWPRLYPKRTLTAGDRACRDVLDGSRSPSDLWRWMGALPDANGHAHGVAAGSLEVKAERAASTLRPTARR